jgi:hypothetical protein
VVVATQNPAAAFATTSAQLDSIVNKQELLGAKKLVEMIQEFNRMSEVTQKWTDSTNDTFESHYGKLETTSKYLGDLVNAITSQSSPFETAFKNAGTVIRIDPIPLSYDHQEELWRRYNGKASTILSQHLTLANPADARPQMFIVDIYTKDERNNCHSKAPLLLLEAQMKIVAHRLVTSSFLTCKKSLNWWGEVANAGDRSSYYNRINTPVINNPTQWLEWKDTTNPNPQPPYEIYENYSLYWNPSLTDLCNLLHETRP